MKRLKVIHLTVGFTIGGAERLLVDMLPRFDKECYDVSGVSLKGWGPIGCELKEAGIRVSSLGGKGKKDLKVLLRLYKLLKIEKPDILHTHLFLANVAGRVIGKLANVPIVVSSIHNIEVWMEWYHTLLDRLSSRFADRIVSCSDAAREYSIKKTGIDAKRYTTIYNGVDLAKFNRKLNFKSKREELGLEVSYPVIATIGRLIEPQKGLRYLIEAAQKFVLEFPKTQFLIIGDGPAKDDLQNLVKKLGISKNFFFAGMRQDIPEILNTIDIFVLPSLQEGFGIVLIEAMAAGKCIIATKVGGIPEVVKDGETGILIPPKDVQSLLTAMLDLMKNKNRRKKLGERGRDWVENRFSIECTVVQIESLYKKLISLR